MGQGALFANKQKPLYLANDPTFAVSPYNLFLSIEAAIYIVGISQCTIKSFPRHIKSPHVKNTIERTVLPLEKVSFLLSKDWRHKIKTNKFQRENAFLVVFTTY
jgi:hypothetical protein